MAAPTDPKSSEVTPEVVCLARRTFIKNSALFAATATGFGGSLVALTGGLRTPKPAPTNGDASSFADVTSSDPRFVVDEERTPFDDVTTYNNFYEFGVGKGDPA